MFGFLKKKGGRKGSIPSRIPVGEVTVLSSRGLSEQEIIDTLRRQGYSLSEIDRATKEALRNVAAPSGPPAPSRGFGPEPYGPPEPYERPPVRREIRPLGPPVDMESELEEPEPLEPPQREEMPEMPTGKDFSERPSFRFKEEEDIGLPPEEPETIIPIRQPLPAPAMRGGIDRREIEELAETIVEEKWQGVSEKFRTLQNQFQQINNRITSIELDVKQLKSQKGGESVEVREKMDTYKQSISDLNSKIESMEKVLKNSLTPMLESMRSMSDTIKAMKGKRGE